MQQLAFPAETGGSEGGYVLDNMEGAVDQAAFLARVDIPVAVVGARGTGKMYVAKIVHDESGGAPDGMVIIDCREFRNRREAQARIQRELEQAEGRTLVFKSPQLLRTDVQNKLARQLASRTLADSSPPRYLPRAKFVALFPENLDKLMRSGGLSDRLASVFSGHPILIPPMRERKRAVMRWAEKILGQECLDRGRELRGFTPEAERAMLSHEWTGNISEIRQRVARALDHNTGEWITPLDLGLERAAQAPSEPVRAAFLRTLDDQHEEAEGWAPSAGEELAVALAEAVIAGLESESPPPLGTWLSDEVVLAARLRYRQDVSKVADFLQTSTRNIHRWLPKIVARDTQRDAWPGWTEVSRLVRDWVREAPLEGDSPLVRAENLLLQQLEQRSDTSSVKLRAGLLGVSIPTYQKRRMPASGEA